MSSTNKTNNLGLNKWIGTDVPKREDFNIDNEILDNIIGTHNADAVVHITDAERNRWNSIVSIDYYTGNGALNRNIKLDCPKRPELCLVFPEGKTLGIYDASNGAHYGYMGIASRFGCTSGIALLDNILTVSNTPAPIRASEYVFLNESGVDYVIVSFI